MPSPKRRKHLDALGIQPWTLRRAPPPAAAREPSHEVAPPQPSPLVPDAEAAAPPPVSRLPSPAVPLRNWAELQQAVASCTGCRLCKTRTRTVFGVGPEQAPLMVVGEGPGADEDAQGEPFVGRAGKLLDEMLKAIGRSRRTDTFIANVVKCRPPENREPAEDEAEACLPYLEQQLRHVKPKLIVALGRVAAQRLLATDEPLTKLRGRMHAWGADRTPLYVTYHPAYLLRSPGEKAKSWQDLKEIHRFLKAAP